MEPIKISKKRLARKSKRSRLFQEPSFDAVDQDFEESDITADFDLNCSKTSQVSFNIRHLTPSKSESDLIEDITIDEENIDMPTLNSYKIEDENYPNQHDSVLDIFTESEPSSILPPIKKRKSVQESEDENETEAIIESKSKLIARYYTLDNIKIIVLKEQDLIHFHGICKITVLHGEIEILGSKINKTFGEFNAYSFRGSSLLYIKNITTNSEKFNVHSIKEIKIPSSIIVHKNSSVLLIKKLADPSISFIEKHISQQILPKCDENFARVVFEPNGDLNLIRISSQWNYVIDDINEKTKLLVCGGKGVGKSTFLRYAVNRLLVKFKKVRIIDLDPGQSEFTVPGCISVITVDKFLLGPNFSHLQPADKSMLSNISIAQDPGKYIQTIICLLKDYKSEFPTLINYMGYTQGLGLNILCAAMYCVQPTNVLQISSEKCKRNFKYKLTPDIVKEHAELFNVYISPCRESLTYSLQEIFSVSHKNNGWTAEPRQLREMCILSYFGQAIDESSISIYSLKQPMFEINIKDIELLNADGTKIPPDVVNANLVALCCKDAETSLFICHGWGIVRGMDDNVLVLITPENDYILDTITCLVSNGLNLPPSIYMTPDESLGYIPYTNKGDLMYFGQIPKRSHLSAKK